MDDAERRALVRGISDEAKDALREMLETATVIERGERRYPVHPSPSSEAGSASDETVYEFLRAPTFRRPKFFSMDQMLLSMFREIDYAAPTPYLRHTASVEDLRLLESLTVAEVSKSLSWTFGDENGSRQAYTSPQLAVSYLLCKTGYRSTRATEVCRSPTSKATHEPSDGHPEVHRFQNRDGRGVQFRMLCLPAGHGKTNVAINGFMALLRDRNVERLTEAHAAVIEGGAPDDTSVANRTMDELLARVVVVVVPNNVYGHWHRRLHEECAEQGVRFYPPKVGRPAVVSAMQRLFEDCASNENEGATRHKGVLLLNPKQYRQSFLKCGALHGPRRRYWWFATVLDELSSHVSQMCKCDMPRSLQVWGLTATPSELIRNIRKGFSTNHTYVHRLLQGVSELQFDRSTALGDRSAPSALSEAAVADASWLSAAVIPPRLHDWIRTEHARRLPLGIHALKHVKDPERCVSFSQPEVEDEFERCAVSKVWDLDPSRRELRMLHLLRLPRLRSLRRDPMQSLTTLFMHNESDGLSSKSSIMRDYVFVRHTLETSILERDVVEIVRWNFLDDASSAIGVRSLTSNLHIAVTEIDAYVAEVRADRRHEDSRFFYIGQLDRFGQTLRSLQRYVPDANGRRRSIMRYRATAEAEEDAALDLVCVRCGCVFSFCDVVKTAWFVDHCEWSPRCESDQVLAEDEALPHLEVSSVRCPCCATNLRLDESIRPLCELRAFLTLRESLQPIVPSDDAAPVTKESIADALRSRLVRTAHPDFKMRGLAEDNRGRVSLARFYDRAPRLSLNSCGTYYALDSFLHHAIFSVGVRRVLVYHQRTCALDSFNKLVEAMRGYTRPRIDEDGTSPYLSVRGISARSLTHTMRSGKCYRQVKDENVAWFLETSSEVRIMYLLGCSGSNEETHGLNLNNTDLIIFYGADGNIVQAVSRGLRMSSSGDETNRKALTILHMT
ncbi:hypothetical protein CYMTET_41730 [Cymbomonas tetramitiformis]|uniref:Uncharacterized protein n=1 Tax=Cymbomonas tetramitiformis TaxID=36881 RepID=A0AAE0C7H0_9CHLO|nr:hypothetical protein CYMTET_41730 [Cymbomonas tetramitiformis]